MRRSRRHSARPSNADAVTPKFTARVPRIIDEDRELLERLAR
jgi:hypothetical protein